MLVPTPKALTHARVSTVSLFAPPEPFPAPEPALPLPPNTPPLFAVLPPLLAPPPPEPPLFPPLLSFDPPPLPLPEAEPAVPTRPPPALTGPPLAPAAWLGTSTAVCSSLAEQAKMSGRAKSAAAGDRFIGLA